jgi:predicted GNAT family acetyltransferase
VSASGTTSVLRHRTPAAFLDAAGDFLVAREAEHNLIFGVCATLVADPGYASDPYLGTVSTAGRVVGAAIMTPPWNLVLSCTDEPDTFGDLAADLDARGISIPGVTGPVAIARDFAESWCRAHGLTTGPRIAERAYRLERVVPPAGVPGRLSLATEADRDLLVAWVDAFMTEALDRDEPDRAVAMIDRSFRTGSRTWYLWDDGGPVSVAAAGGPTPNGIRIGPVYTPPDRRRRGYASALTAATSQAELDKGRRFVFLFTDLANPTSNKIYQAIGYEPVIDIDQVTFVPAGPG